MKPSNWSTARLRRRIALGQAEAWSDEWMRISHKVPKESRKDHPTRKILNHWLDRVEEGLAA